ncbi:MAG: hypothetical protein L3J30_07965 [Marinosulfonomonas sp.]|nr:hypothetical protein [Marinosulfonomonas sp.]
MAAGLGGADCDGKLASAVACPTWFCCANVERIFDPPVSVSLARPKNQFWFDVLYRAHYGHHDFPNKKALFFVPVWFAIPMALIHVALAYMVLRLFGFANPLTGATTFTFIGGITTFIFYEWFHMTAHTNVRKWALERHVTRLGPGYGITADEIARAAKV